MIHLLSKKRIEKGLYWEKAWSLVEGCSPVSRGCLNCWSARASHMRSFQENEKMKSRYQNLTNETRFNCRIRLMGRDIDLPLKRNIPTVYSIWNDLFHEKVPEEFIENAFKVMAYCDHHKFILLTKRPRRMKMFLLKFQWRGGEYWRDIPAPNIILGTSVETQDTVHRIKEICTIPAITRLISFEPVLERIHLPCMESKIHWAVVGTESGPNRRLCSPDYISSLVSNLKFNRIKVFVKQIQVDGKEINRFDDFPDKLRYREFPEIFNQ